MPQVLIYLCHTLIKTILLQSYEIYVMHKDYYNLIRVIKSLIN